VADENNIGASRLIGTNGLDQAVASLTTQVNRMSADIGKLVGAMDAMTGSSNRASGTSSTNWNTGSNRNSYSSNGGGSSFSRTGQQGGGKGNGGGGTWSNIARAGANKIGGGPAGGSKIMAVGAVGAGVASALTNYGNKNMSNFMTANYLATQSAIAGGYSPNAVGLGINQGFNNQYGALSVQDSAQAFATNQYTFGNSQFNGQANPAFTSGQIQVGSFAYANPTLGAGAAATAAQQTYSARSLMMSQALGLAAPIGPNGAKTPMSTIAQSLMQQTFGNQNINLKQFNAATQQGGSLAVNMQYWGQQMGWNQSTIQEYQGILQGQVAAQAKGMSSSKYYTLLGQAQNGDKNAQSQLGKTTGLGTSMFEAQRNLNATNTNQQMDLLQSFGPAFDRATNAVNDFSSAITSMLKTTGLDKLIGAGSGYSTALSSGLSSLGSGFGLAGGALGAMRLFGGSGGAGGLFSRGAASGGMSAAAEANGVYNVTSLGNAAGTASLTKFLPGVGTTVAALGAGQQMQKSIAKGMNAKGADTAAFMAAMVNNNSGDILKRMTIAKAWLAANPNAQVDPTQLAFYGVGPNITSKFKTFGAPVTSGVGGGGASGSMGNALGNGSANVGASDASVIRAAETQLGVPYVYGGESPGKGMDCSGLTQWAYGQAGVKIPRVASDQQSSATPVDKNKTQPGDLLFVGNPAHHVVMSIGNGQIIEAPHTGEKVRIRALNPGEFDSAGRFIGNVGNMNGLGGGANGAGATNTLSTAQSRSGGNLGAYGGTSEADAIASALAGSLAGIPLTGGSQSAGGTSGTTPVGSTPAGNGLSDKGSLQTYAKQLLAKYGWSGQWNSFNALEMSEAGWNVSATNPSSGAYGLPQALPASKLASAGADWRTNGDTQLNWMMDYIKGRYGSPDAAWSFHQKNNWYASGAWSIDQDQAAQVHKGEMIIPAKQAETVRNAIASMMTTGVGGGSQAVSGGLSIGTIQVNLPQGYAGTKIEAQQTGKMIVDAITNDDRIKQLQRGQ